MKKNKTNAVLERRRLARREYRARQKAQREKGKVWVCLYKRNMVFSEPVFLDQAEAEIMHRDCDGAGLELRVLSAKKAEAVKIWIYKSNGRVHGGTVNGVAVEPLFPACLDLGQYQDAKTRAGGPTLTKAVKNGR